MKSNKRDERHKPMMPKPIVSPPGLDIDFNDPAQNLEAFTRVFVDTNPDHYSVGWYSGTVYAVIGDSSQIIPLMGIDGIGTTRCQPIEGAAGYRAMNRELAYYKDLQTGAYLDAWVNPLNNETCEPFPIHNMTVNAEMTPMMKMDVEGTMVEYPFLPPWEFLGPQAQSTFELHASVPSELQPDEWPRESSGPKTRISEMFMRFCQIDDLANKDLTSIPYIGVWTRLSSWFPWMLMGQAEGHLFFRCNMTKYARHEDLPADFLAKAEKDHPEYMVPPEFKDWGKHNDSTFNMYKKERTPKA